MLNIGQVWNNFSTTTKILVVGGGALGITLTIASLANRALNSRSDQARLQTDSLTVETPATIPDPIRTTEQLLLPPAAPQPSLTAVSTQPLASKSTTLQLPGGEELLTYFMEEPEVLPDAWGDCMLNLALKLHQQRSHASVESLSQVIHTILVEQGVSAPKNAECLTLARRLQRKFCAN